jgi:DNA-binding NtrC family response regulator
MNDSARVRAELEDVEILVAEDDTDIRELLSRLLAGAGAKVTTAADGAEAIQMASLGVYDLLVTDLRMPEMDGMELIRAVRRAAPRTRIVMITAYGDVNDFIDAMQMGADAFVRKPFTVDRILDVIRSSLEGTR